jgi:hypothetical protein
VPAVPTPPPAGPEPVVITAEILEDPEAKAAAKEKARRQAKRARRVGLGIVNIGLGLHYARMVIILVAILAAIASVVLGIFLPPIAVACGFVMLLCGIFMPLAGIGGSILCLWAPQPSGARPWAIAALCLDLLAPVVGFALMAVGGNAAGALMGQGEAASAAVGLGVLFVVVVLAYTVAISPWVCFMLFLTRLARYLRADSLASDSTSQMGQGIVLFFAPLLLSLVVLLPKPIGGCFFGVLMLVWMVFFIMFLFRLLALIGSVRQVVARNS